MLYYPSHQLNLQMLFHNSNASAFLKPKFPILRYLLDIYSRYHSEFPDIDTAGHVYSFQTVEKCGIYLRVTFIKLMKSQDQG